MAATEAQIRAATKWNKSRDNITIRLEKETGQAIREAAHASGQSVTAFILGAIQNGGGASLPVDYAAILAHIAVTGETFEAFLNRAVEETIDRDNQKPNS